MLLVRRLSEDTPSQIILQFVGCFGVWMLAERIGLSGVLTIVSFAIAVAQEAPDRTPARLRVPSYAVWETAVFVLNVLAFFLIGLQIRPIMEALDPAQQAQYLAVAGAVLATCILARILWVMSYNTVVRWQVRRRGFHPPRPMMLPTARGGLIISWSGMRGIVTLAAALALPLGNGGAGGFPFRDLIVLTAFIVVLGTLVLQGLTLRPLLGALAIPKDDLVDNELSLARKAVLKAAMAVLEADPTPSAERLRQEYAEALGQARRGIDAARR